jgi:hypothetical protein
VKLMLLQRRAVASMSRLFPPKRAFDERVPREVAV